MSYAEQKWTVGQVNEKIDTAISESDAGKDLYIAGIPRGLIAQSKKNDIYYGYSNRLLWELSNCSGWIISSVRTNTSAQQNVLGNIRIDDSTDYGIVISTNTTNISSTDTVKNIPIRFENNVKLFGSQPSNVAGNPSSIAGSITISYILDPPTE